MTFLKQAASLIKLAFKRTALQNKMWTKSTFGPKDGPDASNRMTINWANESKFTLSNLEHDVLVPRIIYIGQYGKQSTLEWHNILDQRQKNPWDELLTMQHQTPHKRLQSTNKPYHKASWQFQQASSTHLTMKWRSDNTEFQYIMKSNSTESQILWD